MKKLFFFILLFILTNSCSNKNIAKQAKKTYDLFAKTVDLKTIKKKTYSNKSTMYVCKVPDYYDKSLFKHQVSNFVSFYNNIDVYHKWIKSKGYISEILSVNDNSNPTAFITVMYKDNNDIIWEYRFAQ